MHRWLSENDEVSGFEVAGDVDLVEMHVPGVRFNEV